LVFFCTIYVEFRAYICVLPGWFIENFLQMNWAEATVFSFGYAKGAAGIKPAAP
jgi:hypothetical protein